MIKLSRTFVINVSTPLYGRAALLVSGRQPGCILSFCHIKKQSNTSKELSAHYLGNTYRSGYEKSFSVLPLIGTVAVRVSTAEVPDGLAHVVRPSVEKDAGSSSAAPMGFYTQRRAGVPLKSLLGKGKERQVLNL